MYCGWRDLSEVDLDSDVSEVVDDLDRDPSEACKVSKIVESCLAKVYTRPPLPLLPSKHNLCLMSQRNTQTLPYVAMCTSIFFVRQPPRPGPVAPGNVWRRGWYGEGHARTEQTRGGDYGALRRGRGEDMAEGACHARQQTRATMGV